MNRLETQALIEDTGNYDEEDTEYILDICEALAKHIGFEDNRRDSRYIVKFHDIFYYMPDEYYKEHAQELDSWFEEFCWQESEFIEDELKEKNIDLDYMLTRYDIGHYRGFLVDIPEITNKNIAELAMKIYDEFGYEGVEYPGNYIYTVNLLQTLEDNYVDYWINYLEINEAIPRKVLKEIKENYKKDKERKS